jgi:hypothetical protein
MIFQEGKSMSIPISGPLVPAQPHQLAYGVSQLALFPTYTRESYLAAFGVQAPAWDPSRVRKTWFDSTVDTSDPANAAVYKIIALDGTGNWGPRQMLMTATEAAKVNLPGSVTYPAYAVAPAQVTSGGSPVNPNYLSLEADARALLAALGGNGLVQESGNAIFPIVYPASEPRRIWDFVVNGVLMNAGALLLAQNANGVGAPGHWDTSRGDPAWVPDPAPPTGANDMRPPRDMPLRDLLPNEKLQPGLMGVSVVRTDLLQQQNIQEGQFTADDRATLQQIYQILSRLS